jgi:hypothetical protein
MRIADQEAAPRLFAGTVAESDGGHAQPEPKFPAGEHPPKQARVTLARLANCKGTKCSSRARKNRERLLPVWFTE